MNKKWKALRDAVQQNDVAKVIEAAAAVELSGEKSYYDFCKMAIQQGSGDVLGALLKAGDGFQFSKVVSLVWRDHDRYEERIENEKLARELIKEAYASPNPETTLPALYTVIKGDWNPIIHAGDFLNEDSPIELLEVCLKDKSAYTDPPFGDCVEKTGLFSTPKLDFILSLDPGTYKSQPVIDKALITVSAKGDIDKAVLLLAHGASADTDNAEALCVAAKSGNQDLVDLLLPYVSLKIYGEKIVTQLQYKNVDQSIIQSVEDATKAALQPAVKTPAPETVAVEPAAAEETPAQDDRFKRLDDDTLTETKILPNGSTLMTLFNFAARQQTVIVMNPSGNNPQPAVVSFDDLDKAFTDSMQEKFDALGKTAKRAAQYKSVMG